LPAEEVADVVGAPGEEVVHRDDLVPALEEELAQVRAEEPRSSGDQDAHVPTSLLGPTERVTSRRRTSGRGAGSCVARGRDRCPGGCTRRWGLWSSRGVA